MEDYADKYNHKLLQFVTTLNSKQKYSIHLQPKDVKKSEFCPISTTNVCESTDNLIIKVEVDLDIRDKSLKLCKKFLYTLRLLPENQIHTH